MATTPTPGVRAMDAARRLVRALASSSRAVQAKTGLSGAQLFLLRQLDASDAPLSVGELAERTLTHQSTVSGILSRLVERRLVTRAPAAADARRAEVAITARGRSLVADAPATVQVRLVRGLERMPAAQREALASAMEAWLAAAGLDDVPAGMFFEEDAPDPPARTRGASGAAKRAKRRPSRGE